VLVWPSFARQWMMGRGKAASQSGMGGQSAEVVFPVGRRVMAWGVGGVKLTDEAY
jgi:hypothetical protein